MLRTQTILFTTALLLLAGVAASAQTLPVVSFNIRYNNPADSVNAWPNRIEKVTTQILFHDAAIVGVQEALHGQLVDMQRAMPQYRYVGVGRDDGAIKGEYSAIFYDTILLQLQHSETFWLSETPTVTASKSWDAAITRICTWARLKHKKSNKVFYVFNTHFDHLGAEARRQSALLLLKKISAIAGNSPVMLTGDFNAGPEEPPIQLLGSTTNKPRLYNTQHISAAGHYGPQGTFNGFKNKEKDNNPIDFIFVTNHFSVQKHATLSQSWGGLFSSDHFPVFALLRLK